MSLIKECSTSFGCKCLYRVLSVEKNATAKEIKKAYRKLSLLLHPDKVPENQKEESTKKFQTLSKVHYILSDPERRATYDETGIVDTDIISDDESPEYWSEYWQAVFPTITVKDIDDFMASYVGSEEELNDLKKCYIESKGDMNIISQCFIGYKVEEEDRFRKILMDLIEEEEIPAFPKFTKEKPAKKLARQKKYQKEASEVEAMGGSESLIEALRKRSANRGKEFHSMISNLEAKYCGKESKGRKKIKM